MDRIQVAKGEYVSVGDYVRIIAQTDLGSGPPIGAVLPVVKISSSDVSVPWDTPSGTYGKFAQNVERAYDPDYCMDEGL